MTARAIYFLFTMTASALIALTIGSSALLRAAVCMGVMLLLSLLSVLWARHTLKVSFVFSERTIERGKTLTYRAQLRYASLIPIGRICLVPDEGRRLAFEPLPFKTYSESCERAFLHRGVYALGSGRAYIEDMFSLFCVSKKIWNERETVMVLPKCRRTALIDVKTPEDGPETKKRFQDDASAPSGIREWQDGDTLKRVHWKLTMKTCDPSLRNLKMMVKTYDEAARPDTVVLCDLTPVDAVDEWAKSAEDAVCEASLGAVRALMNADSGVRLALTGEKPEELQSDSGLGLDAFSRALAACAFDRTQPFEKAVYECTRRTERTGCLIAVTAKLTMSVFDALIRVRRTTGIAVMVIWITDQKRRDAQDMLGRLENENVQVRTIHPFETGE